MATISTHVLDTALGRPAGGMAITLERASGDGEWTRAGGGTTSDDGRVASLLDDERSFGAGDWRLTFATGDYHAASAQGSFYPSVVIEFRVPEDAAGEHFHVPLLVSPFGYSTYRGS